MSVEVIIFYQAVLPIPPLGYTTKLTCPRLPQALVHHEENNVWQFTVGLEVGDIIHQETRPIYDEGPGKPEVKDFMVGGTTAKRVSGLGILFANSCPPLYRPVYIVVEGVVYEGEGEVPSPDGSFKLTWKPAEQEWTYIQQLAEWDTGRSGFKYGASCNQGVIYRHVNIWPSGEPIGGGPNGIDLPVTLDSGAGQFSTNGTATIKVRP